MQNKIPFKNWEFHISYPLPPLEFPVYSLTQIGLPRSSYICLVIKRFGTKWLQFQEQRVHNYVNIKHSFFSSHIWLELTLVLEKSYVININIGSCVWWCLRCNNQCLKEDLVLWLRIVNKKSMESGDIE